MQVYLASCSNVIIGRDFNTNFDKPGGNVRLLETFMDRNELYNLSLTILYLVLTSLIVLMFIGHFMSLTYQIIVL